MFSQVCVSGPMSFLGVWYLWYHFPFEGGYLRVEVGGYVLGVGTHQLHEGEYVR